MTCTTYTCWVNDGRPWKNCIPINNFVATLYRHGYTGPTVGIGDLSHLTASPPEDHCPYSHTPWPGVQPYPYVMAIDIMANEGLDIIDLGGRLFNDKSSNVPGTEPIKYINWTDSDGNCWHDSWMPSHTRFASTDRGHIHISFRTDYVTSTRLSLYDPYSGQGGGMPDGQTLTWEFMENGTRSGIHDGPVKTATPTELTLPETGYVSTPNNYAGTSWGMTQQDAQRARQRLAAVLDKLDTVLTHLDAIEAAIGALQPGTGGVSLQQVREEIAASTITPPGS